MRGGDIFMGAFNAEQVMYNHFGYRTPIPNLYMRRLRRPSGRRHLRRRRLHRGRHHRARPRRSSRGGRRGAPRTHCSRWQRRLERHGTADAITCRSDRRCFAGRHASRSSPAPARASAALSPRLSPARAPPRSSPSATPTKAAPSSRRSRTPAARRSSSKPTWPTAESVEHMARRGRARASGASTSWSTTRRCSPRWRCGRSRTSRSPSGRMSCGSTSPGRSCAPGRCCRRCGRNRCGRIINMASGAVHARAGRTTCTTSPPRRRWSACRARWRASSAPTASRSMPSCRAPMFTEIERKTVTPAQKERIVGMQCIPRAAGAGGSGRHRAVPRLRRVGLPHRPADQRRRRRHAYLSAQRLRPPVRRHGRARPGHPRLLPAPKTWMPGTRPGMTVARVGVTRLFSVIARSAATKQSPPRMRRRSLRIRSQ